MDNQKFQYTGTDNLEVMLEAKKYNTFLASLVLKQNISPESKILDIGSGIGLFAELIQEKGYEISCLEPDTEQSKILQKKGFITAQAINEYPDNYFDFMYAFNVLEHIENDQAELAIWAKKLKQGGKMLIYVPAFNVLFSSMDKKVGHYRRYRRKELTEKMINSGLGVFQLALYVDSIGFFISLLYKWINRGDGEINRKSLIFYDRILFPISRIMDLFCRKLLGKNVYIVVEKR